MGKISLSDQGISMMLESCHERGSIYYSIKDEKIGQISSATLISIIKSKSLLRGRRFSSIHASDKIFMCGLSLKNCRISTT